MTHISTLEHMAELHGHVGDPVSLTRLLAKIMHTLPKPLRGYPALLGNANRCDTSVWIADCGATKHMTDQKSIRNNYVSVLIGSWIIEVILGATVTAHGYGDVLFEATVGETL